MPNLDSGCHVCFCKVDCLQIRGKLYTAVSAPVCEAEHLVQRVPVGIHASASGDLYTIYNTCKELQSRSSGLWLCNWTNDSGTNQLDLKLP